MKEPSETVSESVKYLGQGFLLAYYLPALVFILAHLYVLIPAWIGSLHLSQPAANKLTLPLIGEVNLSSWVNSLLWSLIVGIVLFVLNNILIRLFEGKPSWLKNGLLSRLTRRYQKECKNLYGELTRLRNAYLEIISQAPQTISQDKFESFRLQLKEEHEKIEKSKSQQTLPHNVERVCPTSFGNVYAIAEEYPYERYGIDSVLFWPHLRMLMQEKAPNHSLRLTQQKTVLDLSINFAFLSGVLTVEIIITICSGYKPLLLVLAGVAFLLSISFYQASVAAIQGLGELIKVSFDYYRGLVLKEFNLKMPDNLTEEQALWVKLASFIRRGDAFYFPEEYRDSGMGSGGIEDKKKDD
ncbi:hypothetical protein [Calothrix sp. NIES-2098]|uniref:hypothetical protein n=1 Tax=Calothrix sp. NIES-2098 TaxID=1954171 RepID=UPI000B5F05CA|nr:hypothetical protein NIES2098_42940 [Calothrix sp. NIES-2098]